MAVRPQFLAYLLEQLEGLGRVSSRRMFGGVGLYSGELFFGIIDDDTVFFKTDASNSADYTARNMPRFMPFPVRPEAVLAYYEVPADIIEDAESLVAWARKSVIVALTAHAAKGAVKRRPKTTPRKKNSVKVAAKKKAAKKKTRLKTPRAKPRKAH